VQSAERPPLVAIEHTPTPERVAHGDAVFNRLCSMCHGIDAVSGGTIADLRYAAPATFDAIDSIVRGGAYRDLGMPAFGWLTEDDVAAIKDYLLTLRAELMAAGAR